MQLQNQQYGRNKEAALEKRNAECPCGSRFAGAVPQEQRGISARWRAASGGRGKINTAGSRQGSRRAAGWPRVAARVLHVRSTRRTRAAHHMSAHPGDGVACARRRRGGGGALRPRNRPAWSRPRLDESTCHHQHHVRASAEEEPPRAQDPNLALPPQRCAQRTAGGQGGRRRGGWGQCTRRSCVAREGDCRGSVVRPTRDGVRAPSTGTPCGLPARGAAGCAP